MSAANDDDNVLFSQDDIDKLLNAQSLEEAEESIASGGSNSIDDFSGELSQDDIDRLLNASSLGQSNDEPEEQINSSFDIEDKALFEEPASNQSDVDDDDDDDDLGELSQDDIDKMLSASSSAFNEPASVSIPESSSMKNFNAADSPSNDNENPEDDSGAFDLISQDDIDKLMATDDDILGSGFSESDMSTDMNLDALGLDEFDSAISSSGIEEELLNKETKDEEYLLDPSEAWSIQDCLITQEALDNLLSENINDNSLLDDDILKARKAPPSEDDFKVNLSEDEPDFDIESKDGLGDNDLDTLLNDAPEDMDDLINEISQDDIDSFLKESDDLTSDQGEISDDKELKSGIGKDETTRNIISQDDIDALLASTDEEDEDILADMEMDEDLKSVSVPVQNIASGLPEDDNAQVILEEADEPAETLADGTVRQLSDLMETAEDKPKKKSSVLKIIIIIFIILTLIAGSVAGLYFMFFKEKVDELLRLSKPKAEVENSAGIKTETPDIPIKESQELSPGTINLENFIIFTQERGDGVTYISLDVSIDYSHSTVFDAVNSRLPYYRGVIYDAINNALKSDRANRITESELLEIVQNALKQSLPDMKLNKVAFVNFKTG